MTPTAEYTEHRYPGADPADAHKYLAPVLRRLVAGESHTRLLDLGCGNGSLTAALMPEGCDVDAVDLSSTGIQNAKEAFPKVRFHCLDVTGSLDAIPGFGSFDVVTSAEVVEHLYLPRHLARNSYQALRPGGVAIFTTPYHGYWKNVVMALTGKLDAHFTVLWDGGHIKFWSRRTLTRLLEEAGFRVERFVGVGRVPLLWKSMILVARKPAPRPGSGNPAS